MSNGNLDDRMVRKAHGSVSFEALSVCARSGKERRSGLRSAFLLTEFLPLQYLRHPPGDRRSRIDIGDRPGCDFLDIPEQQRIMRAPQHHRVGTFAIAIAENRLDLLAKLVAV